MIKKCSKCGLHPALSYHSYCYDCARASKGESKKPKFRRDSSNKTMCSHCKKRPKAKGGNNCSVCRNEAVRRWEDKQGGYWNWIKKDPERHKKALARKLIYNWVIRGKMQKKPCEVCGNPESESHHEDYSKPSEVRWLCKTHHAEADRRKELFDKGNAVS